MSHFTPEREAEIHAQVNDWWDDLDWAEKCEALWGEDCPEYERLIEFGEWLDAFETARLARGAGPAFNESIRKALGLLREFLAGRATERGIFADKFDELELERRA